MTDTTDAQGLDPNADDGANPTTQASGQDSQPTGFDALPPETQKEIRALRKENADARKRIAAFESANQTELEKREAALKAAEDRATALETRIRDLSARSAVTDAATKANAISARAVYALIRSDLEFGDDGAPTNVDVLIKAAQKSDPELFRAANGSGDGGKGGPAAATGNINDVFREMARTAS